MTDKDYGMTRTEHKIGKITYIIEASSSGEARDSLVQKIKKNVKRDVEKVSEIGK